MLRLTSNIIMSRRALLTRSIGTASLLGLAGVIGGALPVIPGSDARAADGDISIMELMKPGPLPENALGDEKAPITVIEYSSMTCPHCAHFHKDVLPEFKTKYIDTGKVRYIVREFPLDDIATAVVMLARCLPPDKYFNFVNVMYENQSVWNTDNPVPKLQLFAKQAGLTEDAFTKCLNDQTLMSNVTAIRTRASETLGVESTPTFFVNGRRMKSGAELKDFDELISSLSKAS